MSQVELESVRTKFRQHEKDNMSTADKISQAIRDGLNDGEIKKLLGVTQRQIDYRKERQT